MMNKKKLRRYLQELRYIVPTLYFNFHYLPEHHRPDDVLLTRRVARHIEPLSFLIDE